MSLINKRLKNLIIVKDHKSSRHNVEIWNQMFEIKIIKTRRKTHLDLIIIIEWQSKNLQKIDNKNFSTRMNEYLEQVFT